jgi:carbonic anhydrase/acetyltransferase-like protein (isoleucine patch superfamily)
VSSRDDTESSALMKSIHSSVWIAPSAQLFGKISIGEGSSIWHNAVARAECQEIRIGRISSIQDFVMLHVGYDDPTIIGNFCTIAHHATIHGCNIADACLVGIGAVIMDGAVIGGGSIVAAGAVVPEGRIFPPSSVIAGIPARVVTQRDSTRTNRMNAWLYHRNAQATREGNHRAWEGAEYEAWYAAKQAEVADDRDLV